MDRAYTPLDDYWSMIDSTEQHRNPMTPNNVQTLTDFRSEIRNEWYVKVLFQYVNFIVLQLKHLGRCLLLQVTFSTTNST